MAKKKQTQNFILLPRDFTLLLSCNLGSAPALTRGQEARGPALHTQVGRGWAYGGKLIHSDVYLIKISLHQNTSFATTVISQGERRWGGTERKNEKE